MLLQLQLLLQLFVVAGLYQMSESAEQTGLPEFIRLRPGISVAQLDNWVQMRAGTSEVRQVRSSRTDELLFVLLEAAGESVRTADVVAAADGRFSERDVERVIGVLADAGLLLTEGPDDARRPSTDPEQSLYGHFSHFVPNPGAMLERTTRSGLLVLSRYDGGYDLASALASTGLTASHLGSAENLPLAPQGPETLVVVAASRIDTAFLGSVASTLAQSGTPWILWDAFSAPQILISPILGLLDGPCFACLTERLRSHLGGAADAEREFCDLQDRLTLRPEVYQLPHAALALAAAALSVELIHYLSGLVVPTLVEGAMTLDTLHLDIRRHRVLKVPRCPFCSGSREVPRGHGTL